MKKLFTSFFLLLVISFGLMAQVPNYWNNNATSGNENSFPLNQAAGKMCQWLVRASEFSQPSPAPSGMTIHSVSFMISTLYPLTSTTYTNFKIILQQATITDLPVGSFYTAGTMDTVYTRASITLSAGGGTWLSFVLDHNYPYDPTKALVVQMEQCSASGATTVYSLVHSVLAGNRRVFSVGGCPFAAYSLAQTNVVNCGIELVNATVNCNYSWGVQTSGTTSLLQAVWAPTELICWAAGAAGTVRKTINGGTSWTDANPNPGVITGDIYNIYASDVNNALLTTSPGATFIYRTTNGGTNWTQVFTQPGGFIDAIVMKDATTGFAYGDPVGTRWSNFKTVNGGATWDSAGCYLPVTGTEAGWNNAMCIVGNNIWFGTNNTKVYHSTNLGATGSWSAGVTTGNLSTYGVWFTSATNGLCVGTIAQKTTDGGATWVNGGTVGGAGNMTSTGGVGTYFWLTRGNNTYGTNDGGATWTGASYTGTQALWGSSVTTGANGCYQGWSVGATGTIVKLTGIPVGISNNQNGTPNAYMLQQNYPNPFNPTTNISFSLPKSGMVELKIYDVLGRESAVVLNEFRQAGNYSVEFNASQLSSGVYFYTIVSGEFTDTKKMVLVK